MQLLWEQIAGLKQENEGLKEKVRTSQEKTEKEQEDLKCLQEAWVGKLKAESCQQEALSCSDDYHKRKHAHPTKEVEEVKVQYDSLQEPPQSLRPLVKVEYTYEHDEDHTPKMLTKEIPYTATVLAKLKKEYSRNSKESETEYAWRVSLTARDQITSSE